MKKPNFFILLLVFSISLSFSACDSGRQAETAETEEVQIGTEELENTNRSLLDVIRSREELSIFFNLVESARLASTLETVENFTIFAPTNEAFNKLPEGKLQELQALTPQELENFIGYHMTNRRLTQDEITSGGQVDALNGLNFTVRAENGTTMVDDARVVTPSIGARNGVIHTIDKVLIPENVPVAQ